MSMTEEPHDRDTSASVIYGHTMTPCLGHDAGIMQETVPSGNATPHGLGIVVRTWRGLSDEVRQQILVMVKAHRS